ncbi:hypothetical protein G5I_04861 [Acromyrmex echinatior]|uniref:Uncharacterized protein n=1 Tax=Acromyrmex echinatior TaxID=103372 RepID=F4WGR4_ACREC|nr:hypothetical protein G5I_04861 [Acromyrmex echinatior]
MLQFLMRNPSTERDWCQRCYTSGDRHVASTCRQTWRGFPRPTFQLQIDYKYRSVMEEHLSILFMAKERNTMGILQLGKSEVLPGCITVLDVRGSIVKALLSACLLLLVCWGKVFSVFLFVFLLSTFSMSCASFDFVSNTCARSLSWLDYEKHSNNNKIKVIIGQILDAELVLHPHLSIAFLKIIILHATKGEKSPKALVFQMLGLQSVRETLSYVVCMRITFIFRIDCRYRLSGVVWIDQVPSFMTNDIRQASADLIVDEA